MWKKILSTGLALVMTVGLCACGGSDGGSGNGGSSNGGNGGNGSNSSSSSNAALAKEHVYRATTIDIPELVDSDNGYLNFLISETRDGRIYLLLTVYDYSKDDANNTSLALISMNEDGSDVQVTAFEMPGADENVITPDGSDSSNVPEGAQEATMEESAGNDVLYDGNSYFSSYSDYYYFCFGEEGDVYGIRNVNTTSSNDGNNYNYENSYSLCRWDASGTLLSESVLEGIGDSDNESGEYTYLRGLYNVGDGQMMLFVGGSDHEYHVLVNADGTVSEKQATSDATKTVFESISFSVQKEDNLFYLLYYADDNWSDMNIVEYDAVADTLGEPVKIPGTLAYNGLNNLDVTADGDLIFTQDDGIYTYHIGDEAAVQKMNYVNSDLNITYVPGIVALENGDYILAYQEYYSDLTFGLFTYVSPEEITDKQVVVLGGQYIGTDETQRVVEFNRKSTDYRIVVKDYSDYSSYDDSSAGTTQLNNDIISGNMPDILLTRNNQNLDSYISKGLFADIGALIAADSELSKVEFLENVFEAYSVNGTLYHVVPCFYVQTMMAKTSLVGDGSDWSMEKMTSVLSGMGDEAQAISELTRDNFMSTALQYCGRDFIDVATGKCNFNSQDFIQMMEFAKTLPEEIDWDSLYSDDSYWNEYDSQYRNEKTLLMPLYISNFANLSTFVNGYFDGSVSYVGFPTTTGSGSYIESQNTYAISAKSDVQDGAWEYVRYYLTDEYQKSLEYGLPVNKSILEEASKEATKKPTYTDYETGKEVEYDSTMTINGEDITIDPLTQEQLDQLMNLITTVNTTYYYSDDVFNIINEEMGAFYSDQKTAADTAAIIQSRVQLYVDENQ